MKFLRNGSQYSLVPNSVEILNNLPVGRYTIMMSDKGPYLVESEPVLIKEKIYGKSPQKVQKVWRRFVESDRSIGCLAVGHKGTGKSIFTNMICNVALEAGYPVIIINKYIPNLEDFLENISNECVVVFDEYDKTYPRIKVHNAGGNDDDDIRRADEGPQSELLSMFDGMSSAKRLWLITANHIIHLSDYIVNRPGRFQFAIVFGNPNLGEMHEYMRDNLEKQTYEKYAKDVCLLAMHVPMSWDILRCICVELQNNSNNNASLKECLEDINLFKFEPCNLENSMEMYDGAVIDNHGHRYDMCCRGKLSDGCYIYAGEFYDARHDRHRLLIYFEFGRNSILYDEENMEYYVDPSKVTLGNQEFPEEVNRFMQEHGPFEFKIKLATNFGQEKLEEYVN